MPPGFECGLGGGGGDKDRESGRHKQGLPLRNPAGIAYAFLLHWLQCRRYHYAMQGDSDCWCCSVFCNGRCYMSRYQHLFCAERREGSGGNRAGGAAGRENGTDGGSGEMSGAVSDPGCVMVRRSSRQVKSTVTAPLCG